MNKKTGRDIILLLFCLAQSAFQETLIKFHRCNSPKSLGGFILYLIEVGLYRQTLTNGHNG
jgi:hypothetical protein